MKRLWVLLFFVVAGCATTRVTNSWVAPSVTVSQAERPQKTLVVALFPDEASRRTLEESLSARLSDEGITAVPANRYFQGPAEINRQSINEVAQREGFDSVVMTRFMGIRTDFQHSGGGYWGLGLGYGGYYGYAPYFGYAGGWYYPDYWYPVQHSVVQTSLYDAKENGKLLWSATSETIDPHNSTGEMDAIANKVVKRMNKDAVL